MIVLLGSWHDKSLFSLRHASLFDKLSDFPLVLGSAAKQGCGKKKTKIEGNMRRASIKAGALVTAIALSLSAMASADPLAPGKPAGVHAAQGMGDKEWLVFGGVGVVVAAVLIANAGSGDHAAVTTQPITVVAPTTT